MLLFGFGAALGIDWLGGQRTLRQWGQDAAIGTIQTFALGAGLFFVQLSSSYAAGIYALLFGAILGISDRDVSVIALTAFVTLTGLGVIARPLLSAVLALLFTWFGLTIGFYAPYPISFLISELAFVSYVVAVTWQRLRASSKPRSPQPTLPVGVRPE